jgi:hypothetical protein
LKIILLLTTVLFIFLFIFCGFFVVQPLGAIPEGVTILYWRQGLNIPFVASADGLLEKSGAGVSLLGRVLFLGKTLEIITPRKIAKFPYSEFLYLWSTQGKKYEK